LAQAAGVASFSSNVWVVSAMASAAVTCLPEVVNMSDRDLRDATLVINLTVQMLTGKAIAQAQFLACAPISSVKQEIQAAAAIPVRHQRLIWQSEVLADDCVLSDLALPTTDAVMVLVVSLPPEELLEDAKRLMRDAAASLDVLNARDFTELKNMSRPPGLVDVVFEAVMQLLAGIDPAVVVDSKGRLKDRSWNASRKMLKDPKKFLNQLHNFQMMIDNGQVSASNIQAACTIRDRHGDEFTRACMAKSSVAAAGLTAWVISIIMYYGVVSEIRADFEGFDIMTEIRDRLGQR